MIYIDPEKIHRVFMNIMKNALEAMKKGGTFKIQADEKNGEIMFSLADTGKGIPEEIRDKLFDSFVTSGKKGGTGLGLAIVKKVIEEHKGRIEVESEQGVGTTFKIYFPKMSICQHYQSSHIRFILSMIPVRGIRSGQNGYRSSLTS